MEPSERVWASLLFESAGTPIKYVDVAQTSRGQMFRVNVNAAGATDYLFEIEDPMARTARAVRRCVDLGVPSVDFRSVWVLPDILSVGSSIVDGSKTIADAITFLPQ